MRRSNPPLEFETMESRELLSGISVMPHQDTISAQRLVSVGEAFGPPTIPAANSPISGTLVGFFLSPAYSHKIKVALGGNLSPLGGVNGGGILSTNGGGRSVIVLENPEGKVAFRIGKLNVSPGLSRTATATVVKATGIYEGVRGSGTAAFSIPTNNSGFIYYATNSKGNSYGNIQFVMSLNP